MLENRKDIAYASFEPTDDELLTLNTNNRLLVESPILSSALSNIFPYLLLIDNFLEITTWTNEDKYQNFLLIVIYVVAVLYWNYLSYIIIPITIATVFSCLVWSINSVIYDSKWNEKPTIDEILHTLHNITARFEMLLRPIRNIPFSTKSMIKVTIITTLLTPLHVALLRYIISPKNYICFWGTFVLTYHSPLSFTFRRLLWRSFYIRLLAFCMTGMNIRLSTSPVSSYNIDLSKNDFDGLDTSSKSSILADFKIENKKMISATELQQTVIFEILENERRWVGVGWSKVMMPNDRPYYCYESSQNESPPIFNDDDHFTFPTFASDLYDYKWHWLDTNWTIDEEFNRGKNSDGWVYYDNSWSNPAPEDGFTRFTRSRKWMRKAVLTIHKQD